MFSRNSIQLFSCRLELLDGITLEEFDKREVIKEKGYSFEVESDYHDWDSALDAMETLQKDMEDLCQRDQ